MSALAKNLAIIWGVLAMLGLAQGLEVRSIRTDLHHNKLLVSMSAAQPFKVDGLKESMSYALTLRDVHFGKGNSSFSLILASRSGGVADIVSVGYNGANTEANAASFLQLLVNINVSCLGNPSTERIKAMFGEVTQLIGAAKSGKALASTKQFGSIVMASNVHQKASQLNYLITLRQQGQPGKNGWARYCQVRS